MEESITNIQNYKIYENLNEISHYMNSLDSTISVLEKDLSVYINLIKKLNIQSDQKKQTEIPISLFEKCATACQLSYNRKKTRNDVWLDSIIKNDFFKSVHSFNFTNNPT